jgi:hypothetical protein
MSQNIFIFQITRREKSKHPQKEFRSILFNFLFHNLYEVAYNKLNKLIFFFLNTSHLYK